MATSHSPSTVVKRRDPHLALVCAMVVLIACGLSGCRLMVAAGKMVMGDPMSPSAFEQATGTNLNKSEERLLIIATAPYGVLTEFPSLQLDLVDRITLTLESGGVQVVPSNDVSAWYDDHGTWGDYTELAEEFDADYVMHLDLRKFSYKVPHSPTMVQGQCEGRVQVYKAPEDGDGLMGMAFDREVSVTFPESYPVPRGNQSDEIFVDNLIDRVALQVSRMMYRHRVADTIF